MMSGSFEPKVTSDANSPKIVQAPTNQKNIKVMFKTSTMLDSGEYGTPMLSKLGKQTREEYGEFRSKNESTSPRKDKYKVTSIEEDNQEDE